jgi:hypothetical protein
MFIFSIHFEKTHTHTHTRLRAHTHSHTHTLNTPENACAGYSAPAPGRHMFFLLRRLSEVCQRTSCRFAQMLLAFRQPATTKNALLALSRKSIYRHKTCALSHSSQRDREREKNTYICGRMRVYMQGIHIQRHTCMVKFVRTCRAHTYAHTRNTHTHTHTHFYGQVLTCRYGVHINTRARVGARLHTRPCSNHVRICTHAYGIHTHTHTLTSIVEFVHMRRAHTYMRARVHTHTYTHNPWSNSYTRIGRTHLHIHKHTFAQLKTILHNTT